MTFLHPSMSRSLLPVFVCLALLAGCSGGSGESDLKSGIRELKRGNYSRAKTLLERSIARRPGHIDMAEANNLLGLAAMRLNDFEDAMNAFEQSHRLNPNYVEPVYNLGVLAAERQDYNNAIVYLNDAASLNKNDARALEYLAEIELRRHQPRKALNFLYLALDRDNRSARIYNAIGCAHFALKESSQAKEALMMALECQMNYGPALYNLAVVHDVLDGQAQEAQAYYKRYHETSKQGTTRADQAFAALERLKTAGTIGTSAGPVIPAAESRPSTPPPPVAVAVTTAPPVAAVTSTPVRVVEPPPPPSPQQSAHEKFSRQAEDRARNGQVQAAIDLYVRAAEAASSEGRKDLEEKAYREAIRVAPDQPRSHALLGQHLYERGQYEQSARHFKKASSINPDFAPAQLGLARLAVRDGEYDAALIHYRKVIAATPSMADASWEYAQLFDKYLSMKESAAREYRDFATRFPADQRAGAATARANELTPASAVVPASATRRLDYRPPVVRNRGAASQAFARAETYQQSGDWERAIFFYLRSLEHDDQLPGTFYNLGICYTATGEKDSAREAYRQAIRLRPDDRNAQYNLALLYRDSGDSTSAIRLFEEIIRKSPDYAAAHHALGSMYAESSRTHDKAKQHFAEFLRLAPDDRVAPSIRQWMQTH